VTIERIVLTATVTVNHGDGMGARSFTVNFDYEPGDNDGLARALMARLREVQNAALLAGGPVDIPLA